MIKHIIFDMCEVIISGAAGIENTIAKMLNKTPEEVDSYLMGEEFIQLLCGNLTEKEYIDCILQKTNWPIEKEELKKIIRQNQNKEVKGTKEIIKQLEGKYNLVLLSDHVKEWITEVKPAQELLPLFHKCYFSYELNSTKAELDTFQKVLSDLQAKPEEVLFIDDSEKNIEVAKQLNITGIVFKDSQQLANALNHKKIL